MGENVPNINQRVEPKDCPPGRCKPCSLTLITLRMAQTSVIEKYVQQIWLSQYLQRCTLKTDL